MRKFYLRWWLTPNWPQVCQMRCTMAFHGVECYLAEPEYFALVMGVTP